MSYPSPILITSLTSEEGRVGGLRKSKSFTAQDFSCSNRISSPKLVSCNGSVGEARESLTGEILVCRPNSAILSSVNVGEIGDDNFAGERLVPRPVSSIWNSPPSALRGEHHVVDVDFADDTHPCVFRVPESLTATKPEAYAPPKLGLGPLHHRRPGLYTMHRKKTALVIQFLDADPNRRQNIKAVVDDLKLRQYLIRASYDQSLDLEPRKLAEIVAVDAIYLLSHFDQESRSAAQDVSSNPDTKKQLAADILMLENQIPGDFLVEIWGKLNCGDDNAFSRNVLAFCERESPLQLASENPIDVLPLMMRQGHLLSVMYGLILPRSQSEIEKERPRFGSASKSTLHEAKQKAEIAAAIGVPGAAEIVKKIDEEIAREQKRSLRPVTKSLAVGGPAGKVDLAALSSAMAGLPGGGIMEKEISIMQKVPWAMILDTLKKVDPDHDEDSLASASQLTRIAHITFARAEKDGIRNVEFKPGDRKLCLPVITLHSNSEVVLRNLLAYEAAIVRPGSAPLLAEYVDLMCHIVATRKDVEILRDAGIIAGELEPAEISSFFKGMRRSIGDGDKGKGKRKGKGKGKETSKIGKAIEEVNRVYDGKLRVKAARFIKKSVHKSWKYVALLLSVMVLMLLALQAFCVIYDCNKHWLSMNSMKYNPLQSF